MADKEVETVIVVQSSGQNGAVLLERKVTTEVVQSDPPPIGMYL